VVLYGWHTVKAALENPQRSFHRLLATENAARRLTEDNVKFPVEPTLVRPEDIAAIAGAQAVHQGLYAEADPLESPELEDVATGGTVLVLDQITDPHNVGAILRSAAAFAVSAVVTRVPVRAPACSRAASPAVECVRCHRAPLARALGELREARRTFWSAPTALASDLAIRPCPPLPQVAPVGTRRPIAFDVIARPTPAAHEPQCIERHRGSVRREHWLAAPAKRGGGLLSADIRQRSWAGAAHVGGCHRRLPRSTA
jgi:hypothetical protein